MLILSDRKSSAATKEYVAKQERIEGREANPLRAFGKLADKLGVTGLIDRLTFNRLASNRLPDGKTKLTPRDGATRLVCKDACFNCPKGLTLAYLFSPGGEAIKQAMAESIAEAVLAVAEPLAEIRASGQDGKTRNAKSGELLVCMDIHESNRAGEPHLHGHAYIMNASTNPETGGRLALKTTEIHKAAKKLEADFHKRLRGKVESMGFRTKDKGKFWDLADVPAATVRKFSSRRSAIEKLYESVQKVTPALRDKAGIMTREAKPDVVDLGELKERWAAKLTGSERAVFRRLRSKPKIGRGLARRKAFVARLLQMNHNGPDRGKDHEFTRE